MYNEKLYKELEEVFRFGKPFKGSKKQKKNAEKQYQKLQAQRAQYLSLKEDIEEAEHGVWYLSKSFDELVSNCFNWSREPIEWCKKTHQENLGCFQRGLRFLAESAGIEVSADNLLEAYKEVLAALKAKMSKF